MSAVMGVDYYSDSVSVCSDVCSDTAIVCSDAVIICSDGVSFFSVMDRDMITAFNDVLNICSDSMRSGTVFVCSDGVSFCSVMSLRGFCPLSSDRLAASNFLRGFSEDLHRSSLKP